MNRTAIAQDNSGENFSPLSSGILQRKCTSCSSKTTTEDECAGCANKNSKLQRKLSIGSSNDPLEHEADRVADQVMSMSPNSSIAKTAPKIQRASKNTGGLGTNVPASVNRVLSSSGRRMKSGLRQDMEQRFGQDFSQVRIHTSDSAAKSARDVSAHAYTAGRNVVFGSGQFAPGTGAGRRLLAHELTHVVQQGGSNKIGFKTSIESAPIDIIRRHTLENDPPAPSTIQCPVATTSPVGVSLDVMFGLGSDILSPAEQAAISGFANNWNASPVQEPVRIDGFASIDGGPGDNWPLSCRRAEALRRELITPSDGSPGITGGNITYFANGETEQFSSALEPNRRAQAHVPAGAPTAVTHQFRAAAWSFLSCATCNPFTDDGTLGVTPPVTEPPVSTTHRQLHHIEASLGSYDGRTIAPGSARLIASGNHVGVSHYCGASGQGHIVSSTSPSAPRSVISSTGVQGIEFESELSSRVGSTVPATLPGSPCGFFGTHSLVPAIGNTFVMRLFADGTKESEFTAGSLYPSHHLYEDGAIKMFGGSPVHPRQDFAAWTTSTTGLPLALAEVGLKALRFECCHPGAHAAACATACRGGFSVPTVFSRTQAIRCAAHGAILAASGCPAPCAPSGSSCPPITRPSNP